MTFKHLRFAASIVVVSCVLLQGCADTSFESTWKSTKKFYASHINTPATIDYEDKGSITEAEAALSRRMRGIENQLVALERVMENSDRPPSSESVSAVIGRFPWLSGMVLLDVSGDVLEQHPVPMKQLDFTPLLERTGRRNDPRSLRGMVQDTPLGAEVAMAIPVYRDADMLGLFITHFDMRALLSQAEEPGDLVILSPEAVLWGGRFDFAATPLAGQDWAALVKSNSIGTVSNANGEFLWIVRYIGAHPLIFAVPTRGEFPEDPGQLSQLANQSPALAPVMDYDPARGGSTILDSPAPSYMPGGSVSETPLK